MGSKARFVGYILPHIPIMEGVVSFSLDQFIEPCTATALALGLPVDSDGSLKRDPGQFLTYRGSVYLFKFQTWNQNLPVHSHIFYVVPRYSCPMLGETRACPRWYWVVYM